MLVPISALFAVPCPVSAQAQVYGAWPRRDRPDESCSSEFTLLLLDHNRLCHCHYGTGIYQAAKTDFGQRARRLQTHHAAMEEEEEEEEEKEKKGAKTATALMFNPTWVFLIGRSVVLYYCAQQYTDEAQAKTSSYLLHLLLQVFNFNRCCCCCRLLIRYQCLLHDDTRARAFKVSSTFAAATTGRRNDAASSRRIMNYACRNSMMTSC